MSIDIKRGIEEKGIDDNLELKYRNGMTKNIKIGDLIDDKNYASSALLEINNYFKELLTRLGRAGFLIEIPLKNILEALTEQAWLLYIQSKAFATPRKVINKNDVLEAISYLDRVAIIVDINKRIYNHHKQYQEGI